MQLVIIFPFAYFYHSQSALNHVTLATDLLFLHKMLVKKLFAEFIGLVPMAVCAEMPCIF